MAGGMFRVCSKGTEKQRNKASTAHLSTKRRVVCRCVTWHFYFYSDVAALEAERATFRGQRKTLEEQILRLNTQRS